MSRKIPFAIDRNLRTNLSVQLANGFRSAIRSGYYKPGERLPSFTEIVRELGVSIRAPREAMKILTRENLVRSRPRLGCEVLARGERLWKGRILAVLLSDHEGSYYISTLIGAIRKTVVAAGYQFFPVTVDHNRGRSLDFSQLDAMMKEPVDYVIAIYPGKLVSRHLAKSGVPAFAYRDVQMEGGLETVRFYNKGQLVELVEKIRAAGVRSVLSVEYGEIPIVTKLLKKNGLSVERMVVRVKDGPNYLEGIKRQAMEKLAARLSDKKAMPELVLFTDDFVAFGGLMAIAAAGIRVPEELKILTMANRGFEPVFPVKLAKVEFDPRANGVALGQILLAKLGAGPMPAEFPQPRFVPGKSL